MTLTNVAIHASGQCDEIGATVVGLINCGRSWASLVESVRSEGTLLRALASEGLKPPLAGNGLLKKVSGSPVHFASFPQFM